MPNVDVKVQTQFINGAGTLLAHISNLPVARTTPWSARSNTNAYNTGSATVPIAILVEIDEFKKNKCQFQKNISLPPPHLKRRSAAAAANPKK